LMALYLIKGSDAAVSMTSVSVCIFSMLVFISIQTRRSRPASIRPFIKAAFIPTVALISLVLMHSIFMFSAESPFGLLITKLGRDITLTDRTFIWHDVYAAASGNPLLGVGFGGFWIGRVANIPWNETMTWVLGQAHNGYIDTYLQIGLIGCFLLAGVIFTALGPMLDTFAEDFDLGSFRITLFLTILFVNITETTLLRGDHHLWFIFMAVMWTVPATHRAQADTVGDDHSADMEQHWEEEPAAASPPTGLARAS